MLSRILKVKNIRRFYSVPTYQETEHLRVIKEIKSDINTIKFYNELQIRKIEELDTSRNVNFWILVTMLFCVYYSIPKKAKTD